MINLTLILIIIYRKVLSQFQIFNTSLSIRMMDIYIYIHIFIIYIWKCICIACYKEKNTVRLTVYMKGKRTQASLFQKDDTIELFKVLIKYK